MLIDVIAVARHIVRATWLAAITLPLLPPPVMADAELPVEVRTALTENARQLSPITVGWTQEIKSSLAPEQALARVQMTHLRPEQMFFKSQGSAAWQDGKLYCMQEHPEPGRGVTGVVARTQEASFDGKVLYGGIPKAANPILFKRFMQKAAHEDPAASHLHAMYFAITGFRLPQQLSEWTDPHAASAVLDLLEQGGVLARVESVPVDGRELLRVVIDAENPVRRRAEQEDLDKLRKELAETSRETPERQQELVARVARRRELPATRRFTYDLDPELNYAVRRWEQSYEPDVPLERCICDGFQHIEGRNLWLPRQCEIELHEFPTLPDAQLRESLFTQVVTVSGFDGSPVPDSRFVLNYTAPGTRVMDATLPEAAQSSDGYVTYTVPAQLADLDAVIAMARSGKHDPGKFSQRPGWSARAIIFGNLIVWTALGACAWLRRRNRRRSST